MTLAVAAFAVAGPDEDVYEAGTWVFAQVENVHLVDQPPQYKPHDHTTPAMTEQLVEGHTTYVVLEMVPEVHEEVEGSVNVTGFVDCQYYADVQTKPGWWNGIGMPTRIDRAGVECRIGSQVVIAPTVYCQLTGNWECGTNSQPTLPTLFSTGNIVDFVAPSGQYAYLEEYVFEIEDLDGTATQYYAWAVPVLEPWINAQGEFQNLFAPIPEGSYDAMGTVDFASLWLDRVPHA